MSKSYKYLERFFRETLFLVPIILLLASLVTAFWNYSIFGYIIIGNTFGYSLFVNYAFIIIFTLNKNYCVLTRLTPIGLVIINIIDIVGSYMDRSFYSFWYVVATCGIVFLLSLLYYINKKI